MEEYAAQLCPTADCYATTFLQVSGLRVVYTILEDNAGERSDLKEMTPLD